MTCNNIRAQYGLCLCVVVLFTFSVQFTFGFAGGDRQRPNDQETSRQQQLQQEAQNSAAEISGTLTQILQLVNQNRRPSPDLIEQTASMLQENRRYARVYDDTQKAKYMLLQAWTYFYQGNPSGAMNWALRSCKTDQTSQDAWISQALFCQLNSKRPLEPRIRRSDQRQNAANQRTGGRANQPNDGAFAMTSELYGQKGTLNFDLSGLRSDLLREHFNRLDLKMQNGANLTYIPGENILCMLLWQVEPSAADAGDVSDGREIDRQLNNDGMRNDNRGYSNNSQSPNIKSQGQYFSNLYEIVKNHPQITYFSLNTNGLEDAKKVAADMDDDFEREIMDKPIVFAAEPESGAAAFVGVNAKAPFMLIADKEGVIRYAGPAANFMPAFVLTHLTDVEIPVNTSGQIDVQTPNTPNTVDAPARIRDNVRERPNQQNEVMTREMRQRRMNRNAPARTRPAVDPNHPAVDPNAVSVAEIQQNNTAEAVEINLENMIDAEQLLALAKMEIETSRTLRGKSPEKGIEACKKVLENYPETEYAEQAREQLRRVPQRYWEKYEIADLLGY